MLKLLFIAMGGALGSVCRYGAGRAAISFFGLAFPYGTLCVNVLGSFLIGLCVHAIPRDHDLGYFIVTGFLGGFTTFSAFSIETLGLWRSDQPLSAFLYVFLSLFLSFAAVYAGASIKYNVQ